MSKVTIKSEVETYDLKDVTIEIHHGQPCDEANSIYTVSRSAFEMWLESEGKLKSSIITGGDNLIICDITPDEYWNNTDWAIKCADLKDFMILREKKELANAIKMIEGSLLDTISAVTNNEFAAQCKEAIADLKNMSRHYQLLEDSSKVIHAETFGQFTS